MAEKIFRAVLTESAGHGEYFPVAIKDFPSNAEAWKYVHKEDESLYGGKSWQARVLFVITIGETPAVGYEIKDDEYGHGEDLVVYERFSREAGKSKLGWLAEPETAELFPQLLNIWNSASEPEQDMRSFRHEDGTLEYVMYEGSYDRYRRPAFKGEATVYRVVGGTLVRDTEMTQDVREELYKKTRP